MTQFDMRLPGGVLHAFALTRDQVHSVWGGTDGNLDSCSMGFHGKFVVLISKKVQAPIFAVRAADHLNGEYYEIMEELQALMEEE